MLAQTGAGALLWIAAQSDFGFGRMPIRSHFVTALDLENGKDDDRCRPRLVRD
jgi:hypothetical protein